VIKTMEEEERELLKIPVHQVASSMLIIAM
jgi:hypothetical protein